MRLLNVDTLKLESYHHAETTPPYAILSHVWEEEEVTFQDIQEPQLSDEFQRLQTRFAELETRLNELNQLVANSTLSTSPSISEQSPSSPVEIVTRDSFKGRLDVPQNPFLNRARRMKGWSKIEGCCLEATRFGLKHIWVDTCCIDKSNSTELSEAINSMFAWYRDATLCFAYLSDANGVKDAFDASRPSKWFSRGWTLQELLAPSKMIFFQRDWEPLGTRSYLHYRIALISTIDPVVLKTGLMGEHGGTFSIATKMSWAAGRQTTRPEDRAYSLMGLFQVNMPTLYGEGGSSAFRRLQSEIFAASGDHSILAWCSDQFRILTRPQISPDFFNINPRRTTNLLAPALESFSPSPRWQDLPLNLVNAFDIGTTETVVPVYPGVSPKPYDLESAVLKNAIPKGGVKYSASSHGMRLQLLLERVWVDVPSDCHIFIAHLACMMEPSNQIVGILLVSEKVGQYRRAYPDVLVSIEKNYHNISRLMVEDIYIVQNEASLEGLAQGPDRVRPHHTFNGKFNIQILSKEFDRSGFALVHSTRCWARNITGGMLLTFGDTLPKPGYYPFGSLKASDYAGSMSFSWGVIDFSKANILLFGRQWDKTSQLIAVVWLRYQDMLEIAVLEDVDPANPIPDDITFTSYYIYDSFISHWAEQAGDAGGINVVFREHNDEKMMYVVIL